MTRRSALMLVCCFPAAVKASVTASPAADAFELSEEFYEEFAAFVEAVHMAERKLTQFDRTHPRRI